MRYQPGLHADRTAKPIVEVIGVAFDYAFSPVFIRSIRANCEGYRRITDCLPSNAVWSYADIPRLSVVQFDRIRWIRARSRGINASSHLWVVTQ
jgi:hypothetical protein